MFVPWERGLEKLRFKVVSEYKTQNRGVGDGCTQSQKMLIFHKSFAPRSQRTWMEGSLRMQWYLLPPVFPPLPPARSGGLQSKPTLRKINYNALYLKFKYSSNN